MNEIKLNGESKDIVQNNISKLKEIFPEIVTENKIDFDKLKLILGNSIDENHEKYNFTWPGKIQAIKESQKTSSGTLRPCKEESKNWDSTENLYIEGDNLEVLKLLQKSYNNKIKIIYIDPPYNTGNDFIYKDDYSNNLENYLELSGQVVKGGEGERERESIGIKLSTNTETNGRFHSNWLSMMYSRLKLAKNLLTDDGVIFISIDDNELTNLQKICDEIFGEENFLNFINLKAKASSGASGGGQDKRLKKNVEYLLIYSKSNKFNSFNSIYKNQNLINYINERRLDGKGFAYTQVMVNSGEEYYIGETKDGKGNSIKLFGVKNFEIKTIKQIMDNEKISEEEAYFKYFDKIFTSENAQTSIRLRVKNAVNSDIELVNAYYKPISGKNKNKEICVGFIGKTRRLISFLRNVAYKNKKSIIKKDKIGTLWDDMSWSSVYLEGGLKFNNGKKPIELIKRLLELSSDNNSIILDFFSGSGTTAHSVMSFNSEQNFNTKFILVQIPELIDKKEKKNYDNFRSICEIGKERIRRAGDKILEESDNKDLDVGFKVFKLDSSNLEKWDPDYDNLEQTLLTNKENIKPDRTELDLIYEIMLKYGIDLTLPIEKINNIYSIGYGALLICLEDNITKEIAKEIIKLKSDNITRVVFKESGFKSDADKTNIKETLRINNIDEFITI